MIDADKRAFAESLAMLGIAFGYQVDQPLMRVYWALLQPLPLVVFKTAAEAAALKLKWFPKPAELLELAGMGESQRKLDAVEAWEMVRLAMTLYDYTSSVDFGPLVNAVVRTMGGWQALCARDSLRELIWERKRFEELYGLFSVSKAPLRGQPLDGCYGGTPVRIAIAGKLPPLQIEAPSEISSTVRELAESKAFR